MVSGCLLPARCAALALALPGPTAQHHVPPRRTLLRTRWEGEGWRATEGDRCGEQRDLMYAAVGSNGT
eukprot:11663169-Alexandrium_andersonii.AAC.1